MPHTIFTKRQHTQHSMDMQGLNILFLFLFERFFFFTFTSIWFYFSLFESTQFTRATNKNNNSKHFHFSIFKSYIKIMNTIFRMRHTAYHMYYVYMVLVSLLFLWAYNTVLALAEYYKCCFLSLCIHFNVRYVCWQWK